MIVGGVGNGPAEEDRHWDLNPGAAAIGREDHAVLEEEGERTTQLWQSGDPLSATQLMVPGARIKDFYFLS